MLELSAPACSGSPVPAAAATSRAPGADAPATPAFSQLLSRAGRAIGDAVQAAPGAILPATTGPAFPASAMEPAPDQLAAAMLGRSGKPDGKALPAIPDGANGDGAEPDELRGDQTPPAVLAVMLPPAPPPPASAAAPAHPSAPHQARPMPAFRTEPQAARTTRLAASDPAASGLPPATGALPMPLQVSGHAAATPQPVSAAESMPDVAAAAPPGDTTRPAASHTDRKAEQPQPVLLPDPAPFLQRVVAPVSTSAPDVMPGPVSDAPASAAPPAPGSDVAALVDRITQAREAAAPHSVRAALIHDDFGAVSLRFSARDDHIHVTLGSADPAFAPAVQAAAMASLAGGAADDADTRDRLRIPLPDGEATPSWAGDGGDVAGQQASRDGRARDGMPAPPTAFPRTGTPVAPSSPTSSVAERHGIYA